MWQFVYVVWRPVYDEIKLQPEARYVYNVTCWYDAFPGAALCEVI